MHRSQWRNYKFWAPLLQNIVIKFHESQILIKTNVNVSAGAVVTPPIRNEQ